MSQPERPAGETAIELRNVSRWYGNIVAVNDVTMTIGPGITGLLGPNGAGKTTLLNLMAGFLAPSRGELTVGGRPSWRNPQIFTTLGLVPERDSVYAFLTGWDFVRASARLHRLPDLDSAARRAIEIVDMADAQDRRIATYSKGMRQRIKVAAALVHDPQVLLLDEPFNGMDPRQRDDGPARADGRRRTDDSLQLAHTRGSRADVGHDPGDRGRSARRLR
jgi:ABC-2 type transport system ATP-binding protein